MTLKHRVRVLEEQVEILRRALGIVTASARPATEWLDAQMAKASKGEFRYTTGEDE